MVDLLDHLLAFLLQPVDRRTGLLVDLLAERVEDPVQVLDLLPRLLLVMAKILLQLRVGSLVLELLEHLQNRLLHRQSGTELVDEQLGRRLHTRHYDPLSVWIRHQLGYPGPAGRNRPRAEFAASIPA